MVGDIAYSLASLNYHERHQPAEARVLLEKALEIEQDLTLSFPTMAEYLFYLNNIFRDFRDWFGDTARLNALCDQYTILIQEYEARLPPEKRDQFRLNRFYTYRGYIEYLLGRFSESLVDYKLAGWAELAFIASALVEANRCDFERAGSAAIHLAQTDSGNGLGHYFAAQTNAHIVAALRNDRSLAVIRRDELCEQFGKQAVERLRKAQSLKYLSSPSTRYLLADDRELEPLRSRADFQALLARSNELTRKGQ